MSKKNVIILAILIFTTFWLYYYYDYYLKSQIMKPLESNLIRLTPSVSLMAKKNNLSTETSEEVMNQLVEKNIRIALYAPFKDYLCKIKVVKYNDTNEIVILVCNKNPEFALLEDASWTVGSVDKLHWENFFRKAPEFELISKH